MYSHKSPPGGTLNNIFSYGTESESYCMWEIQMFEIFAWGHFPNRTSPITDCRSANKSERSISANIICKPIIMFIFNFIHICQYIPGIHLYDYTVLPKVLIVPGQDDLQTSPRRIIWLFSDFSRPFWAPKAEIYSSVALSSWHHSSARVSLLMNKDVDKQKYPSFYGIISPWLASMTYSTHCNFFFTVTAFE